ncbi:MAG: FKBP-type peptidyl-prolyl cis-trans isomerase [Chromatiales bacterium]|nr:FKBP-type peptidyl-prolyl cis-trans isomerase [Chromatiales bacterium]
MIRRLQPVLRTVLLLAMSGAVALAEPPVRVEYGDSVLVEYEITDPQGKVWISTNQGGPVRIPILRSPVLPALVHPLLGLSAGERKQVILTPDDAFGPHRQEAVLRIARSELPDVTADLGQAVELRLPGGEQLRGRVVAADANHLTIDTNHPLAGKLLYYRLRVLEIGKP